MSDAAGEGLTIKPGLRCYCGWLAAIVTLIWITFGTAPEGLTQAGFRAAGVGLIMGALWMSEALPVPVTALLPLVLFPILGISSVKEAAAPFSDQVIFLYMGGFMLSLAMQRWGLHRRIALGIISFTGTRERSIVWGFILATAFLSMWVSNTATTMMMLPIAISVAQLLSRQRDEQSHVFPLALMLGIAYAATIGGMGTPIGTPTNAVFMGYMEKTGYSVSFTNWMMAAVPLVVVALPLTHALLTRFCFSVSNEEVPGARKLIGDELAALGRMSRGEIITAIVFCLAALCWVSRQFVVDAMSSPPPWLLSASADTVVAIGAALVLFIMPVDFRKGVFVLEWKQASKLPWDVLLLFGGGLSLAAAFESTKFAEWLGVQAGALKGLPLWALMGVIVLGILMLSELASNVATCTAFLPVAAALATGALGVHPLLLTVPVALASSAAFMMPVGTPPNAIVFGTGYVRMSEMVKAGVWLNLLFVFMITVCSLTLVRWVFGV